MTLKFRYVSRARAILCVSAIVVFAGILVAGEFLSHPAHRNIGAPPEDLLASPVEMRTASGGHVNGWMLRGAPKSGTVLLLHSVRSDRREMVDRARFLRKLGYGSLLIDLPAHGESSGDRITYGAREAEGVSAALSFLAANQPRERIGVIGVSLGAAALVLSKPKPAPNAVILESMYPTIEEAISNRLALHFGKLTRSLTPLLIWQLPIRFGISPNQLHPIEEMAGLHCPILIMSGSSDQHTPLSEAKCIFDATPEPKELWIVNGAAHCNLHKFKPEPYESKVAEFLGKYLRS